MSSMVTMVENMYSIFSVARRVNLKSSHHKKKKFNYVKMNNNDIVVIITYHIQLSNHYVLHPKLL